MQIRNLTLTDVLEKIKNNELDSANFSGMEIDDEGANQIAKVLIDQPKLTYLDLSNNKIDILGMELLVNAILVNLNLTTMNLSGNLFNDKPEAKHLIATMRKHISSNRMRTESHRQINPLPHRKFSEKEKEAERMLNELDSMQNVYLKMKDLYAEKSWEEMLLICDSINDSKLYDNRLLPWLEKAAQKADQENYSGYINYVKQCEKLPHPLSIFDRLVRLLHVYYRLQDTKSVMTLLEKHFPKLEFTPEFSKSLLNFIDPIDGPEFKQWMHEFIAKKTPEPSHAAKFESKYDLPAEEKYDSIPTTQLSETSTVSQERKGDRYQEQKQSPLLSQHRETLFNNHPVTAKSADELYSVAEFYLKQGQVGHAHETLAMCLEKNPEHNKAWGMFVELDKSSVMNKKSSSSM